MNEWNTYRVKDVAKFISEKANDCSLPYIALDNIVSWDGYYIPSDSTSDGNSNVCKRVMFYLVNFVHIWLKDIFPHKILFVHLNLLFYGLMI